VSENIRAVWEKLAGLPKPTLLELFAADADRLDLLSSRLMLDEEGMRFDWSKTHLDAPHIAAFEELAEASGFIAKRDALFAGDIVNPTEGRAAEHTAQRGMGNSESVELAQLFHSRMAAIVEAIHRGAMGEVKHLIHVGIGGSALGPALAVDALARDGAMVDVHVVSNIDGCALEQAFAACDPASTMLAIASKTFTTTETMTNAESVVAWMRENGVEDPYGRIVALTAAPDSAVAWGVDETRVLPFSESVGGRYSLWSSIGFPVALALGWRFCRIPRRRRHHGPAFPRCRRSSQPAAARGFCRSILYAAARMPDARGICLRRASGVVAVLSPAARNGIERQVGDGRWQPGRWTDCTDHLGRRGHRCAARCVPAATSGHTSGAGGLYRSVVPG